MAASSGRSRRRCVDHRLPGAESEGLGTSETLEALPLLLQFTHLTLTCVGVLLGAHRDVGLGIAQLTVFIEELAVSAVKDVDVRIGQTGVVLGVDRSVFGSDVTGHHGGTVGGILAVEDQNGLALHRCLEEVLGQQLFVIVVNSTVNVATIVLVLKAAVNHDPLVVTVTVSTIHKAYEGLTANPRDVVVQIFTKEMGKTRIL